MKLLAINWRDVLSLESDASDRFLHEALRRLVDRGHEVALVCCRFGDRRCPSREVVDGIDVYRVCHWWQAGYLIPRAARSLLEEEQFDVLLDSVNRIPFFSPRWSPVPIVALFGHLPGHSLFLETNFLCASGLWLLEKRIGSVYARSRKLALSRGIAAELDSLGCAQNSIDIVAPGIDFDIYRPKVDAGIDQRRVVVLSRLVRSKRVDIAIRALACAGKTTPNLHLLIIGDGKERHRLEGLARSLGVRAQFAGALPPQKIAQYLAASVLLLAPSCKEGWGHSAVQAMATGTPVVASDVPGHRDAIPDGAGSLVPYGDAEAMGRECDRILGDEALYHQMRINGISWASNFGWDHTVERLENALRAAVPSDAGLPRSSSRSQVVSVGSDSGRNAATQSLSPPTGPAPSRKWTAVS